MFDIIAELMEREAALCWTVWCTRCVTTGLARSTLKEVKSPGNSLQMDKKLIKTLQGDLLAMTGWGTLRLETKTSSWTFWRRHTPQSTGSSGSIKWVLGKFLLILENFIYSFHRWKICPTEEPAKEDISPAFILDKHQQDQALAFISPLRVTKYNVEIFFSTVHFPCEWVCKTCNSSWTVMSNILTLFHSSLWLSCFI